MPRSRVAEVFPTQPEIQREVRLHLEIILHEKSCQTGQAGLHQTLLRSSGRVVGDVRLSVRCIRREGERVQEGEGGSRGLAGPIGKRLRLDQVAAKSQV